MAAGPTTSDSAGFRVPACAALLVALALLPGTSVAAVVKDLRYYSPGSDDSTMDLYLPPAGAVPAATVIMFHGGGMTIGDKEDVSEFCDELSDRGFPVLSCNYTLASPGSPSWPQSVQDAKNAVLWIRTLGASEYGLPGVVIAAGGSAGGYLAMMVAVTAGSPSLESAPHRPGAYRVQGFVSMWGGSDLVWQVQTHGQNSTLMTYLGASYSPGTEYIYKSASPVSNLDVFDPPGILFHGVSDTVVLYEHSVRMASAMEALGIPVRLNIRRGAEHGFDDWGGQRAMAARVAGLLPELLTWNSRPPDFNGDGKVSRLDIRSYGIAYMSRAAPCDVNADSVVDRTDFLSFFDACAYWLRTQR